MLCEKVLPLLSEYFDEMLDEDTTLLISQHLSQCVLCHREYDGISAVHNRLRSIGREPAPLYLNRLVEQRLADEWTERWSASMRNELERWWSKIKTTEARWYVTRAMGTALMSLCFLLTTSSVAPSYIEAGSVPEESFALTPVYRQQVRNGVLKSFGIPSQGQRQVKRNADLNEIYFVNYGQSIAPSGKNDTFSVVTEVDRSGAAKIQNILEYPADEDLLTTFSEMIASARFRPASRNGESRSSHVVFMVSKVMVDGN